MTPGSRVCVITDRFTRLPDLFTTNASLVVMSTVPGLASVASIDRLLSPCHSNISLLVRTGADDNTEAVQNGKKNRVGFEGGREQCTEEDVVRRQRKSESGLVNLVVSAGR